MKLNDLRNRLGKPACFRSVYLLLMAMTSSRLFQVSLNQSSARSSLRISSKPSRNAGALRFNLMTIKTYTDI